MKIIVEVADPWPFGGCEVFIHVDDQNGKVYQRKEILGENLFVAGFDQIWKIIGEEISYNWRTG